MASMAVAHVPSGLHYQHRRSLYLHQTRIRENTPRFLLLNGSARSNSTHDILGSFSRGLSLSHGIELRPLPWSISAVGSGLEATFTDPKKNDISLPDVKIVVESRDDEKIHVKVDLTGEETQRAFDEVLTNLARTAPPIPGFRKTKGGKTSNVPKSFLLQILGRDRVTKFLIQEVVSTTMRDFVTKENLKVKSSKCNTTQTAEELESSFSPGKEFGFNATLEIEKPESETSSPSSS
ncbi:hypothetical protein Taro_016164 [Colocasia esculenta]|uniref:peptidylprolyl isomerase n=1 Tax=Colocasia esculenta TaxID=4460 RepID=A0A843UMT8_COLES|nr:hypothetical protein [Colocasia esculenta]